jgi:predicted transcriptional regulator
METEAKRKSMSGSKLSGQEISAYFRKNPKAKKDKTVKKAVEIALDHGGAMNYAVDKIEKLKKGLSSNPEVEKALSYANFGESVAIGKFNSIIRAQSF